MTAPILLIASLDTKGAEAAFLRERLEAEGLAVTTLDFGMNAPMTSADIDAGAVANRGGGALDALKAADRNAALAVMTRGVEGFVQDLHTQGRVAGVIGFGGSGGTAVATAGMRQLPFGLPKLMLSTVASSDVRAYVDVHDITMMHSVADFSGLNPITETVLAGAAGALAGMVRARAALKPRASRPLVAASMFGVTTMAVEKAGRLLGRSGLELVPFHATGVGGRTMESLIAAGYFTAVLDLTTTEWADEVAGGTLTAGPDRLGAAGRSGIPQVIAPGALDMVNFFGPDYSASKPLPAALAGRLLHRHNDLVVLMRTSPAENTEIGRRIAGKLNAATGPVVVLFPDRGLSALDAEGQPFFDPAADAALRDSLRANLDARIELKIVDAHINDDAFAAAAVDALLSMISPSTTVARHA